MPTTYTPLDDDVKERLTRILTDSYPELVEIEIRIDGLFAHNADDAPLKMEGSPKAAQIKATNLRDRTLGHGDAELLIDASKWADLSDDQKDALIDHELYHIELKFDEAGHPETDDVGRPKLGMRVHDYLLTGFREIIQRHGVNAVEIAALRTFGEQFGESIRQFLPAGMRLTPEVVIARENPAPLPQPARAPGRAGGRRRAAAVAMDNGGSGVAGGDAGGNTAILPAARSGDAGDAVGSRMGVESPRRRRSNRAGAAVAPAQSVIDDARVYLGTDYRTGNPIYADEYPRNDLPTAGIRLTVQGSLLAMNQAGTRVVVREQRGIGNGPDNLTVRDLPEIMEPIRNTGHPIGVAPGGNIVFAVQRADSSSTATTAAPLSERIVAHMQRQHAEVTAQPVRRGRGRPPGARNRETIIRQRAAELRQSDASISEHEANGMASSEVPESNWNQWWASRPAAATITHPAAG